MKKYVLFLIIALTLFLSDLQAYACTSFAVYSDKNAFYGMNFDYPDTEIMLKTSQSGELRKYK